MVMRRLDCVRFSRASTGAAAGRAATARDPLGGPGILRTGRDRCGWPWKSVSGFGLPSRLRGIQAEPRGMQSTGPSGSPSPVGPKVQCPNELERVDAPHPYYIADLWDAAIQSLLRRAFLHRNDNPLGRVGQRCGNEERIVVHIWKIEGTCALLIAPGPDLQNRRPIRRLDQQTTLVSSDPLGQRVFRPVLCWLVFQSGRNPTERPDRSPFSVVKQPIPELGDTLSGVVISLRVDQHVRVQ